MPMREDSVGAPWRQRARLTLLIAPAALWLGALIVLPHVELAILSFREQVLPRHYAPSLAQYRTFFTEPLYWHVFVRTAWMSIAATALTLLIAFPIAWVIAKLAAGRRGALLFLVCLIPFWISETVRTLGWMILLRQSGVLPALLVDLGVTAKPVEMLYRDSTIMVGLVYTSMLFMIVPLVSSLQSLDDAMIEAAYDLGGERLDDVCVRSSCRTRPGHHLRLHHRVHADARQLPDADLLGGKNSEWFTEQIYSQFITRFNWEQGAAFGFLLLGLSTRHGRHWLKLTGQRFGDVMGRR